MPTGRLANGQYQAGARRTFATTETAAWKQWTGAAGLARWLGPLEGRLEEGQSFAAPDGTRVTVIRAKPPSQLRLRLEHADWPHARTAQLRVLPAASGVTVALHLEGLPDAATREHTLARWKQVLETDSGN